MSWSRTVVLRSAVLLACCLGRFVASAGASAGEARRPLAWFPTPDEAQQLGREAERNQTGVFRLLGGEGNLAGTAFCICRRHRLLATAAHIVDTQRGRGPLEAVMAQTGHRYRVARAWIHPASAHDASGIIHTGSADVAIVQLHDGGPDLPTAFSLTQPGFAGKCQRYALGALGFPGYVFPEHPDRGEAPLPQLSFGVFVEDQPLMAAADEGAERRWPINHTVLGWPGSSGSPLFDVAGNVVGVWVGFSLTRGSDPPSMYYRGISTDALWDLLETTEGLEPCAEGRCTVAGFWAGDLPDRSQPEPTAAAATAVRLLDEARAEAGAGRLKEAADRLNEAIRLDPWNAELFTVRARILFGHYRRIRSSHPPGDADRRRYAAWVYEDHWRALRRRPWDPVCHTELGAALLHLADETQRHEHSAVVEDFATKLLGVDPPTAVRVDLLGLRSGARANLRRDAEAITDLDEALTLRPDRARDFADLRAYLLSRLGRVR